MSDWRIDHLIEMGWIQAKSGEWIDPEPKDGKTCTTEQAIVIQRTRDVAFVESDEEIWAA